MSRHMKRTDNCKCWCINSKVRSNCKHTVLKSKRCHKFSVRAVNWAVKSDSRPQYEKSVGSPNLKKRSFWSKKVIVDLTKRSLLESVEVGPSVYARASTFLPSFNGLSCQHLTWHGLLVTHCFLSNHCFLS